MCVVACFAAPYRALGGSGRVRRGGEVERPIRRWLVHVLAQLDEPLQRIVQRKHVPYGGRLARGDRHLVRGVLAIVPIGQVAQSCRTGAGQDPPLWSQSRSVLRRTRSLASIGLNPRLLFERAQHAELVPLRVRHDDPGDVSLSNVDSSRPETLESLDFRLLIIRTKIEVHSVLRGLAVVAGHQAEPTAGPVCRCKQMSPGRSGPHVLEAERLAPEGRHSVEVDAVDENTVNVERHLTILAA